MSEITPTTEMVFDVAYYGALMAASDAGDALDKEEFEAMWGRWLAEEIRAAKEDAWDEGWLAPDESHPEDNPYREEFE